MSRPTCTWFAFSNNSETPFGLKPDLLRDGPLEFAQTYMYSALADTCPDTSLLWLPWGAHTDIRRDLQPDAWSRLQKGSNDPRLAKVLCPYEWIAAFEFLNRKFPDIEFILYSGSLTSLWNPGPPWGPTNIGCNLDPEWITRQILGPLAKAPSLIQGICFDGLSPTPFTNLSALFPILTFRAAPFHYRIYTECIQMTDVDLWSQLLSGSFSLQQAIANIVNEAAPAPAFQHPAYSLVPNYLLMKDSNERPAEPSIPNECLAYPG